MIALNDLEIDKWNKKINRKGYHLIISPRYTNSSRFAAIEIFKSNETLWIDRSSDINPNDMVINYSYTFSIIENKDDDFKLRLEKLREYEIGNKCIVNKKIFDIKFCNSIDEKREIHTINGKNYVRYTFSTTDNIPSVVVSFWAIENAFEYAIGNNIFKVNDVVSLTTDRGSDYLILEHLPDNKYLVAKIKEITDNSIYYEDAIKLEDKKLTWSRNHRIEDIINND